MRKLLVLASLGAVVALASVAAAQGAIVSKTTIDLTGQVFTACNGEDVTLTGAATITIRMTDAGSGRVNFGEQIKFKADGVGAVTGAKYNLSLLENVTENNLTFDNGATVLNAAAEENLIGQGSVPNLRIHLNIHETITPDGTITSFKDDITSICQ